MNGKKIEVATEEKDLGVWVQANMKPAKQCAAAAKAANFALGQISRAFHFRKKANLVPLYKTFVRPKMEFAGAAWNPWTEGEKKQLEKVQERFVRMLSDVKGGSYEEKRNDAGLTSLADRRERGDAIETFKTMNGFNKVKKEDWFVLEEENSRPTRRNAEVTDEGVKKKAHVLRMEQARLEVRRNFFNVRAARTWNDIPQSVKEKTSVNAFKNAYDRWKKDANQKETVQ